MAVYNYKHIKYMMVNTAYPSKKENKEISL